MYANVCGFDHNKRSVVFNSLINKYNIIFIAESWFLNDESVTHNKFFIASSIKPPKPPSGHYKGGIYCFAHKNQYYYTIDNNENSDYKLQGNIGSFINGKCHLNNLRIFAKPKTYLL
ncbi:hypothetical protein U3516DRAFT_762802 [Neocallimastix sp. 'constans']